MAERSAKSIEAAGSQAVYERYLTAAQGVSEKDVLQMRSDAHLAALNVDAGLEAIRPLVAELKSDLPRVNFAELLKIAELARALLFATRQAQDLAGEEPSGSSKLLGRAWELRDLLLRSAEALVAAGLLPAREVQKIRQGKGSIDMASDCVALAALYRKNDKALRGKMAVQKAQIDEADALGSQLLSLLRPKQAKGRPRSSTDYKAAAAIRDRLWTLLVQQHGLLRRVGMWRFGEEVDAHVPALQARRGKKRPPAAPPAAKA